MLSNGTSSFRHQTWKGRFILDLTPRAVAIRCILIFALFTAYMAIPAFAQQTISYTDGEDNASAIVITAPLNPTTLNISTGTATQSGVISQSGVTGSIIKNGDGTLDLSNQNTYTGTTTVNAGTLQVTEGTNDGNPDSNNLGSGPVSIASGATVWLDYIPTYNNNAVVYANDFSGAGTLDVSAAGFASAPSGTDRLSGNFSGFTGTLDLLTNSYNQGRFTLGSTTIGSQPSASATIDVNSFATLVVNTGLTYESSLQLNGMGSQGVVLGSLEIQNGTVWAGAVTLEANSTIGAFGSTGTVSGTIGDGGKGYMLSTAGTGTLVLSGKNTFSGGTTVTEGTLLANSRTGSATGTGIVVVNAGGTLGGSGTINTSGVTSGTAVTFASGATLNQSIVSGGLGTSTLTLALRPSSTVDLVSGTKLAFDLAANGMSDQVNVTGGTLTLNGQNFSNFTFTTLAGFTGNRTYNLISTDAVGDILGSLGTTTGTIDGYSANLSVVDSQYLEVTVGAAVPESSTWVMLVGGLGVLGFIYRRKLSA